MWNRGAKRFDDWFRLDFKKRYGYAQSVSGIEVPVRLTVDIDHSVDFLAKIDSGAEYCIFKREYGEMLGLELDGGVRKRFGTAAGAFDAVGHTLKISCLDYEVESQVFFSVEEDFPRNVLGLTGWLDKFRFALVHYERTLYLSHYDDDQPERASTLR